MRLASWILLALAGLLLGLGSVVSMGVAYMGDPAGDVVVSTNIAELAAGNQDVEVALRARRGTAASFAFAFAALFLAVVLGPYRRGDAWAWWSLLISVACLSAATLMRVPTLGTNLGVSTVLALLVVVIVGLLLDVRRLFRPSPPRSD